MINADYYILGGEYRALLLLLDVFRNDLHYVADVKDEKRIDTYGFVLVSRKPWLKRDRGKLEHKKEWIETTLSNEFTHGITYNKTVRTCVDYKIYDKERPE